MIELIAPRIAVANHRIPDGRRSVCVERLDYNADGTIKPIQQTLEGVSLPPNQ